MESSLVTCEQQASFRAAAAPHSVGDVDKLRRRLIDQAIDRW